jgi:hypothetical protein
LRFLVFTTASSSSPTGLALFGRLAPALARRHGVAVLGEFAGNLLRALGSFWTRLRATDFS